MKQLFLKRVAAIMLLLFTIVLIDSCKKMDSEKNPLTVSEDRQKKAQEMVENNPQLQNVIYNLNIKGTSFYADRDGNKIEPGSINSYTYQCDDIEYSPTSLLESITREWSCSQGYRFKIKWKISASLPILVTNPITAASTRGRFRIRNTSGTSIYYESSITPVTVTILGDDPTTGNINRLYSLEYYTQWIPFTYFSLETAPLEHQVFAQTDCEDYPQITNFVTSPALVSVLNPCNRIEEMGITTAETSGGTYITNGTIFGYYALISPCTPPSGSTMPDRQEIQLRYVADPLNTWKAISPQNSYNTGNLLTDGYVATYPVTLAGTISVHNVYYIPERDLYQSAGVAVHGSYMVRYRNVKVGSSTCYGPWSQEFARTF